ncbi:MAG TPA: RNA-binding domain-containing protein [Thermoplasmata archaeon]|nr:RNA-binding domain-containing protein [Thermoplasmata archaeon]
MCDIQLVADVFPTEDRAKVVAAITRLFPDVVIEGEDRLVGRSNSVETFSDQLAKQRIRAAARKVLLRGIEGETASFRLNKQVAAVGKVSFSEEDHPLGDIRVTIRSDDLQGLMATMAPSLKEDGS